MATKYDQQVESEIKALRKKYKKAKPGKELAYERCLEQAARCKVLLDVGFEDLAKNGDTELFSQSPNTPPYERERPAARLYISREKNYLAILKQLDTLVLEEEKKTETDPLEAFLK
jgi:hypothetical protein